MRNTLCCLLLLLSLASNLPLAQPVADPAANAANAAIVVGPAGITYLTHRGDTLMSIAQQWTSRQENWPTLAKFNHIDKDSNIAVNTPIIIPADLLADEPSQAQVEALSGSVSAHSADGKLIVLQVGAKLFEGAQIDTGVDGFLTMSLPDASRISLPSNSRVKFAKLRMARYTKSPRTELTLLRGHVESRVAPLDANKGSYEVRTPISVAGVRGTQFRVGIEGGVVSNEVVSGKVAVADGKHAPELTLNAAEGDIVDAKGVGAAVALLPAPQLDNTGTDGRQIALLPVAGARSYHIQITHDPDAQDVVAEGRSNTPQITFSNLTNGAYFARISAIDKNGLEGLASVRAIDFHRPVGIASAIASSPAPAPANSAPFVDSYDDKQVSLHWNPQAAGEFNVQVAHDAQFTWLIFNTTTSKPEAQLPRPPFGTYYARVQAVKADGHADPFSATQSFIVTDHWVINDGGPANAKRNPASADR